MMYYRTLTDEELLRYAESAGCTTELEKELLKRLEEILGKNDEDLEEALSEVTSLKMERDELKEDASSHQADYDDLILKCDHFENAYYDLQQSVAESKQ